MTNTANTILLLGGTGKTARRIATRLTAAGATPRTAARHDASIHFDWDDPATHGAALDGAAAVYLVPPARSLEFAPQVSVFLDRAEAAGVRHVTFLSARGVEHAPPEAAMRAVELDLAARQRLTHSILRPSWFMQNFSESFFLPTADGVISAPTGDGAEAFVHADDIADVAAATLLEPGAHDGAGYTLTGPGMLTFAEVADAIATASHRPITHADVGPAEWLAAALATGLPAPYAELLGGLLEVIRAGAGATPTDDVRSVTGRPSRSFADFVADPATVAAWTRSPHEATV